MCSLPPLARALRELGSPQATAPENAAQRREAMRTLYETLTELAPSVAPPRSMPDESTSDLESLWLGFCSQALYELCRFIDSRRADDRLDELPSTDDGTRAFLINRLRWVQQRHIRDVNQRREAESLDDTGSYDEASPRDRLLARIDATTSLQQESDAALKEHRFKEMERTLDMFRRLGQTLAVLQRRKDRRANFIKLSDLTHQLVSDAITPDELYEAVGSSRNTVQKNLGRHRDAFQLLLEGYRDVEPIQPMTDEGGKRVKRFGLHVERFTALCNDTEASTEHIPEDLGDASFRKELAEAFVKPWDLTEDMHDYLRNLLEYMRSGAPMRQKRSQL